MSTATRTAITIVPSPLRDAPNTEARILQVLPAQTALVVLAETDEDWCHVQTDEREGYVARVFIEYDDERVPEGFLRDEPTGKQAIARSLTDGVAPPTFVRLTPQLVTVANNATEEAKKNAKAENDARTLVANTWNRLGGLIPDLATKLRINPGVAVAILAIESTGTGFASDGRMIIRFENHLFDDNWGKDNRARYDQHFRYDKTTRYKDHAWRRATTDDFKPQHGKGQAAEWEVFEFACTLSDRGAKRSISMGGPQILGSNHGRIGYETVQQMFDAFSNSERNQVVGFFDFVKSNAELLKAAQTRDYDTFALRYNGRGQQTRYSMLIRTHVEAFQKIAKSLLVVTADSLNLRADGNPNATIVRPAMPTGTLLRKQDVPQKQVGDQFWTKVTADGAEGWVNARFITTIS